jgi:two-component system chemotaxis response regulator CheB
MAVSVLIVDDSSTVRILMKRILETDAEIRVCASAPDGETALSLLHTHKPDVIALDLNMPGLNGQEVTKKILEILPIPIVIVTTDEKSTANPFKLLEAGAVAVVPKPGPPGHPLHKEASMQLITTIKALKGKHPPRYDGRFSAPAAKEGPPTRPGTTPLACIAIGASTGGPQLLKQMIDALPGDFPIPIVVTQHISNGFTNSLVKWIDANSQLAVVVAEDGAKLTPGKVYFAPDDMHMGITRGETIKLSSSGREYGMRPAISYMFRSLESTMGKRCVAVLLSGMGKDGAKEMAALRARGALTIAQDKESSLIHGMPGEAIACGGAAEVLSPEKIVERLMILGYANRRPAAPAGTPPASAK